VVSSTQEVFLRTLASDASSIQHGAVIPAPVSIMTSMPPAAETGADLPAHHHTVKIVLILAGFIALGITLYIIVAPYFTSTALIQ